MKHKNSAVGGVILILLGLVLLAREIAPQYFKFFEWPFIIIGLGLIFLLWAILSGIGGLAVLGSILAGIGGILYYQNLTGDWGSWAYIWSLIPGFAGIGIIISGIIEGNYKDSFSSGLILLLISGMLFFVFVQAFGLEPEIIQHWPVLLILLGLIVLIRALLPRKKRST